MGALSKATDFVSGDERVETQVEIKSKTENMYS